MSVESPMQTQPPQGLWHTGSLLVGLGGGSALSVAWLAIVTWAHLPGSVLDVPLELPALAPLLLPLVPGHRNRALGLTAGAVLGALLSQVGILFLVFAAIALGGGV